MCKIGTHHVFHSIEGVRSLILRWKDIRSIYCSRDLDLRGLPLLEKVSSNILILVIFDGLFFSMWFEGPDSSLDLNSLGYGKGYGQGLSIIPPTWCTGRCLWHFGKKSFMLLGSEAGIKRLPNKWLHLHTVKKKMRRNICWNRRRRNLYYEATHQVGFLRLLPRHQWFQILSIWK